MGNESLGFKHEENQPEGESDMQGMRQRGMSLEGNQPAGNRLKKNHPEEKR